MKKLFCIAVVFLILSVCAACSGSTVMPAEENTAVRETITVPEEALPVVYDDSADYLKNGGIVLSVPDAASDVTQLILYDEVSQVQFMYENTMFTYRACAIETGRTGSALTGIDESVNYLPDTVVLPSDFTKTAIEGHLLTGGGALLFWEDGAYRYSMAAADCSFEKLCDVARLVF